MSKRWLIILLLISVAFNLAVLGSFIYLRSTRPPCPPGRPRPPREWGHKGRGPGRGPGGPAPFIEFGDSTKLLFDRFDKIKQELMRELAKDPINMAQIESIVSRSLGAQADLERDLVDRLIRLRKTMTPEEAKEHFSRRAEEIQRRNFDRPNITHKRRKHR